jgi:hypothetical protein
MFTLPVSLGEAIDKLTILDIKIEKIKDPERNNHCKVEYDILYEQLKDCVSENQFYYKQLKDINTSIWDMQDDIRSSDNPSTKMCLDILNMNDSRFRIKDIINQRAQSIIREQKGYPIKKALFLGHHQLGDNILYIGAVRYLSLLYDEFVIPCPIAQHSDTIKSFYADLPNIKIVPMSKDYYHRYGKDLDREMNLAQYSKIYRLGFYRNDGFTGISPDFWYNQLGLSPSIRLSHFFIPENIESKELYESIKIPYMFVHQKSSNTDRINVVKWDINETLTLDPDVNLYQPDHNWYELAQTFVKKPFNHYYDTLRHAKELHLVDSSFHCMAINLKLDAEVKYCYSRRDGSVDDHYTSLFN